jgi:hypothetical protein
MWRTSLLLTSLAKPPPFATAGAHQLRATALAELAKEVAVDRDGRTGSEAAAPILPAGWSLAHTPGSSSFTMRRTVSHRDVNRRAGLAAKPPSANFGAALFAPGTAALPLPPSGAGADDDLRRGSRTAENCVVELYAPFAVQDPSHWDAGVDICEWVPFEVVVTKAATKTALLVGLASVNSQLRVRRTALVDAAAARSRAPGDVYHLQRNVYQGPSVLDLSKELQHELLEYLDAVGIDARLAEFVCQMGYYLEHDAFMQWHGRLAEFAVPPSMRGTAAVRRAARNAAEILHERDEKS